MAASEVRERLRPGGYDGMSDVDLLAVLVSDQSVALRISQAAGGDLTALRQMERRELEKLEGVGPATASVVMAGLELGVRAVREDAKRRPHIRTPGDVYSRLGVLLRGRLQEEFWVLYLNVQSAVIDERMITKGLVNSSLIHPREVFSPAIRMGAAGMILAHQHPSGDPEPSAEDIAVTVQLVEAGRLLGIPVRDHVVLGDRGYVSLRERGICS